MQISGTGSGPELRDWCQAAGLLAAGQDFADRGGRGRQISVQMARTFITNYFLGKQIDSKKFDTTETIPALCPSGQLDAEWDELRKVNGRLWKDAALHAAANEFAKIVKAQRDAFASRNPKPPVDYPEKTLNGAVMSAWAYVAGMLQNNSVRLERHYALPNTKGRDPLNAAALAKGRHRSDAENYRGLGYRTDTRERGRMVELFNIQAEEGKGITQSSIDIAIKKYHAKQAQIEVLKAQAKEKK